MRKFVAILLLFTFCSMQMFAWGPKGHQIIGDIAKAHLTPAARRNITELLGNDDLGSIANWADEVKGERRESYGWHFVDIPMNSAGFSHPRDCYRPNDKYPNTLEDHHNCIVDRIKIFRDTLANVRAPRQNRIDALKFLVHFVGDIHQPFHAMEEGRGGNDIHVVEFGSAQCGKYPCNLHFEWDLGLLEHTGRSEAEYVTYLERAISDKHWSTTARGTPEDWANESWMEAKRAMLSDGGAVDEAYYKTNIGIVDKRLALAGLRLANLLNETMGSAPGH